MRRIGIDVGGTNTDAVLIEEGKVSGAVKAPTSQDVTTGILDSLKKLAATGVLKGDDGKPKKVDGVMIGTTHFINAVVQRRHLTKVAALRLGLPSGASLPPFCDWPEDLGELVRGGVWMVEGGHEYDGRPFMPLDEAAARVPGIPLQGNIDPALLDAPAAVLDAHVADVLRRGDAAPAHIVNLGHGVPPDADPGVLTRLVEVVHGAAGVAD